MAETILLTLLIFVLYRYTSDTLSHVRHTIQITGRMIVVVVVVFLVLAYIYYAHLLDRIPFLESIFK